MLYTPSSYESEALRLWPQRCNTANPRGVTTVSKKYSLTVARHATVLLAVPSTVHYPPNYKIKNQVTFKNVNKLFTLLVHYKLREVPSYETLCYYNAPFCKRKHLHRG
jgi:hypothetical protein